MGKTGYIYHPTPSERVIQAILDPDVEYSPTARKLAIALFNQDGSPAGLGTGDSGPPGKSSYEVWLDNGGVGTVDDYLASLVGAQGEPGLKGDTGATGAQGPAGNTEIGSADATSNWTTNQLAAQDITGLLIGPYVHDGVRPISLELNLPSAKHSAANGIGEFAISMSSDGGTTWTSVAYAAISFPVANAFLPPIILKRSHLALAAGTYRFKAAADVNFGSAGTLTLGASVNAPMSLQGIKV